MDIVWHKGQYPRKMELTDNGDFDKSANMNYVWARCDLSHFQVDVCIAGKISEKFPREVIDSYVEVTLFYAGCDDALFCCSYTPCGLLCVHIDTLFLINYAGTVFPPKSDEEMKSFVDGIMQELVDNGLFTQVEAKY